MAFAVTSRTCMMHWMTAGPSLVTQTMGNTEAKLLLVKKESSLSEGEDTQVDLIHILKNTTLLTRFGKPTYYLLIHS